MKPNLQTSELIILAEKTTVFKFLPLKCRLKLFHLRMVVYAQKLKMC
jgi:hypothetical protein